MTEDDLPIKCACGCGRNRTYTSKYAEKSCAMRVWRAKRKEQKAKEPKPVRKKPFPKRAVVRGSVEVHDPLCADPYYVTRKEYEQYKHAYPRGTVVRMDGMEVRV